MKRRSAMINLVMAGAVSLLRATPAEEFTLHSDVRLVLLDVSVTNGKGGFVSGLTKENFTVLENGKPQPVTWFADKDLPVTVGILVDESYSMGPRRADVLAAAETFIRESNPHDETFVLNFNDRVRPGLPGSVLFSDNVEQLRSALRRGTPEGKTALYDAVAEGLNQLKLGHRQKKTLVLISDGGDNSSAHTRREVLDMVETSEATIHTIGLYDEGDRDRDPGLLRELSAISGGEAYFPKNSAVMIPVCSRIAKDIRSRYTIGYIPAPQNGAGLRRIRVRVSAPGYDKLTALTRGSYLYDAPPAK
jgi:VWFA-related protein